MVYVSAVVPESGRFIIGKICIVLSLVVLCSLIIICAMTVLKIGTWEMLTFLQIFHLDKVFFTCLGSTAVLQSMQIWTHDHLSCYFTRYDFRRILIRSATTVAYFDLAHSIIWVLTPFVMIILMIIFDDGKRTMVD